MSHVGTETDWAICSCGWQESGVWALGNAEIHAQSDGEHSLAWDGLTYPVSEGEPGCAACDFLSYLQRWMNWENEGERIWDGWPDDDEGEPPGSDEHWGRRPPPPDGYGGHWLQMSEVEVSAIARLQGLLICWKHMGGRSA